MEFDKIRTIADQQLIKCRTDAAGKKLLTTGIGNVPRSYGKGCDDSLWSVYPDLANDRLREKVGNLIEEVSGWS